MFFKSLIVFVSLKLVIKIPKSTIISNFFNITYHAIFIIITTIFWKYKCDQIPSASLHLLHDCVQTPHRGQI